MPQVSYEKNNNLFYSDIPEGKLFKLSTGTTIFLKLNGGNYIDISEAKQYGGSSARCDAAFEVLPNGKKVTLIQQ